MSLHVFLTGECFATIRTLVRLLAVVYSPNMLAKGATHTETFVTHRTDVGLLTTMYTPYV